jgi:hypothetical protein
MVDKIVSCLSLRGIISKVLLPIKGQSKESGFEERYLPSSALFAFTNSWESKADRNFKVSSLLGLHESSKDRRTGSGKLNPEL